VAAGPFRIEPLTAAHDRSRFISGSAALDRYLREQASQDLRRRITTCFVAIDTETQDVAGFYTLAATSVPLDALSPEIARKLPRYPVVPAALLGGLAVAQPHQRRGLGAALLADALLRTARAEVGVFALIVDAKDDAAQRFYQHHGFTLLPGEARRLALPIATALRLLEGKTGPEPGRLTSY
jgi:ribosomal protein S18 acetylase RimI-like enzyme